MKLMELFGYTDQGQTTEEAAMPGLEARRND